MSPRRRFPSTHRAPRQRPASPLRRWARKARNRPARVHLLAPPPGRRRLRPPRRRPPPAACLHRASTPPYFSRAATYQAPRRPRLAASSPDPGLPSSDPPLPIPAASRAAAGEAPSSLAGFTIGRRRPASPIRSGSRETSPSSWASAPAQLARAPAKAQLPAVQPPAPPGPDRPRPSGPPPPNRARSISHRPASPARAPQGPPPAPASLGLLPSSLRHPRGPQRQAQPGHLLRIAPAQLACLSLRPGQAQG